MRTFISILTLLMTLTCFSQDSQEFYVVQKNGRSIEPISKVIQPNSELQLTFQNPELQQFFSSKIVYNYEKAFPESQYDILKNTYYVKTNTAI